MNDEPCPCKECTERTSYCHSKCRDYDIWKREHEKAREKKHKHDLERQMLYSYRRDLYRKLTKKKHN